LFARGLSDRLLEMILAGLSVVEHDRHVGVVPHAVPRAMRADSLSGGGFPQAFSGFEKAVCALYLNRLGCWSSRSRSDGII
jgi:hypothetical protein